jgi:hypothetical protein
MGEVKVTVRLYGCAHRLGYGASEFEGQGDDV